MKFGYKMVSGKIIADEAQSIIIQDVFHQYIGGHSLKHIADDLTKRMVEYIQGKFDWNKNRIQRMLTDSTYLGTDFYPKIIDSLYFDKAYEIMQMKNNQKERDNDKIFSESIVPIKCGKCGYPTFRRFNSAKKNTTRHICTNPECKMSYAILDADLRTMVKKLLIRGEQDSISSTSDDLLSNIHKLNCEIEHELQRLEIDENTLKQKIFKCAALRYESINTAPNISIDLTEIEPCSRIFTEEVKRRVSEVILITTREINIRLSNGRKIGREDVKNESIAECS